MEVASLKRRRAPGRALAWASVWSSMAKTPPTPRGGARGEWPSWCTVRTTSVRVRSQSASLAALAVCCATRSSSVRSDRSSSQVSREPACVPTAARVFMSRARRSSSSARAATTPARQSEWPARYLVPECTTRRAPRSRGRWSGASVASTTTLQFLSVLAFSAKASTSANSPVGFFGLSSQHTSPSRNSSRRSGATAHPSSRSTSCVP
mmetsp:Transcript_26380/g.81180  ORF Transcript_26380/g.81180 Transcript_26380/m.81180 type:complete len:208 (-) Transcript_26380:407-1030(-)